MPPVAQHSKIHYESAMLKCTQKVRLDYCNACKQLTEN